MSEGQSVEHHRAIGVTRAKSSARHSVSTERLRAAFEGMAVGMILKGAEGETLESNPALRRMLGYGEEELRGMVRSDYTHPEDAGRDAELYRQLLEGERDSFRMEKRYVRKDGSVMWGRLSVSRIEGAEDEPAFAVGVVEDITESRKAAQEIERLNRQNWLILDSAGEGIYGLDIEGKTTFVNPAATAMTSFDPEDLIGRSQHEIVHHSYSDGTSYPVQDCPIYAALTDGEVHHVDDEVFWRKDGTSFPVEYTSTPIREDGEVTGAVVTFTDVTERKEFEEALKESEERYRMVVEQSAESIWLFDPDTKQVLESNTTFQEMLGYTADELRRMANYDFVAHSRKDIDSAVQRLVQERRGFFGERKYRRKDGTVMDVEVSGTVIPYRGREVVCGVARDLTEHKRAEEALRQSEERYRALTQNSSDIVTLLRADGTIRYQSPSVERILGYHPEEMIGDNAFDYVHPDDLGGVEMAFSEGLRDPRRRPSAEYRFRHKDGSWVWLESVGTNLLGDPKVGEYVFNSRDVTERRRAEEALKESEERFRGAFDDAPVGVALVGLDGHYIKANRALCEMLGYSEQELLGKTTTEVTHPNDWEAGNEHTGRVLEGGVGRSYSLEKRYVHADGRTVWVLSSVSLVRDPQGNPSHFVSLYQDITERKALEEQLRHRAFHDPLTELPNRALFLDRLGHALARSERLQESLAVLFVDLDNFKVVNDSLGHQAGDHLLNEVAERLRACIRAGDTVARLFGDEFAVLLEAPISVDDIRLVTERVQERLQEPFDIDGREVFVSASIGIATGEPGRDADKERPESLLRRADLTMYVAKRRGKNRYDVFNPSMDNRVRERMELENALRRAIEREEFEVRYEPIIALKSGRIEGLEALARWRHPEWGLVVAEEFILLAEETGLIRSIGRWVFEEACRQARRCNESCPDDPVPMSVNFSVSQFAHQADLIPKVLSDIGLNPRVLTIEITERAVMSDTDFALGELRRLKDLGVSFVIDDYGTGYSCLRYLKLMPVDSLKIDRSFVAGLGKDPGDEAIVTGTIDLAHALGLKVVAEGVETAEQLERLKDLKCDLAQGFYFSQPLAGGEIHSFLAGGHRWKSDA